MAISPLTTAGLADRARAVVRAATFPLLPSHFVSLVDPLASSHELRGRIVAVLPETPDSVTLVIRPGRGWKAHRPGQYVRLGVDVDGVRLWRNYSVTSELGRTDGCFTVTVKHIPDGKVSGHLVRRVQPGTIISLAEPEGDFVLPDPLPGKVLYLTAGSGVTPVIGMLRNHVEDLQDVVVVHSAPTERDVIFGGQLRLWAMDGRIRLIERHTDVEGMLDLSELDELVPDWTERQTWACGPAGLLGAAEKQWESRGVAESLHTERFRLAEIAAEGDGGVLTITGEGDRRTVELDGSTTLLEGGESTGAVMPFGCRMGVCFGCVVPLSSGTVRDLRDGSMTTATPGDDVKIQTCINAACGPVEIDLPRKA